MPSIAQIMMEDVTKQIHYHWEQNWVPWKGENAGGVCFSLCKMWLRGHVKTAPKLLVDADEKVKNIQRKQNKYRTKLRLLKDQEDPDAVLTFRHLHVGGVHSKYVKPKTFWEDAVADITHRPAALITLRMKKGDGLVNHAIATANIGDQWLVFDPNGGVLVFESNTELQTFFEDEFIRADADGYNNLVEVSVHRYDRAFEHPSTD